MWVKCLKPINGFLYQFQNEKTFNRNFSIEIEVEVEVEIQIEVEIEIETEFEIEIEVDPDYRLKEFPPPQLTTNNSTHSQQFSA